MAKFIRKELSASRSSEAQKWPRSTSSEGIGTNLKGNQRYTSEFLNNFYCCQNRRAKQDAQSSRVATRLCMNVRSLSSDHFTEQLRPRYGNGTCGPFAGPQCKDCIELQ